MFFVDYCSSCGEYFEDGVEVIDMVCSTCFQLQQEREKQASYSEHEEGHYNSVSSSFYPSSKHNPRDPEFDDSIEVAEEIKQLERYQKDEIRVANDTMNLYSKMKSWKKDIDLLEKEYSNISFSSNREYNFLSNTNKDKIYTVIQEGHSFECDCPGFHFRKKCRHIEKAKNLAHSQKEIESKRNDAKHQQSSFIQKGYDELE